MEPITKQEAKELVANALYNLAFHLVQGGGPYKESVAKQVRDSILEG